MLKAQYKKERPLVAGSCPVSERSCAEEKDVGNKRNDVLLNEKEIVLIVESRKRRTATVTGLV